MSRPLTGEIFERHGKRGTVYALRFRAYGKRRYVTLGSHVATREQAKTELDYILADVRRGIWQPVVTPVVEAPVEETTFWEFATDWVARRELEVRPRTAEVWAWALNVHLRDTFGPRLLSEITPKLIDDFKAAKVRERRLADDARAKSEKPSQRGLSNTSINKCLKVAAAVLDDAVDYGYIAANPARGKKRRLPAGRPRRTWLKLDEVNSLLEANQGSTRALIATMVLAGLRVSEATGLRWRAVDLANGHLTVEESKTEAGEGRKVDLSAMLREELTLHKADSSRAEPDDLVFGTTTGTRQDRHNVRGRILGGAIKNANVKRAELGAPPIQDGITNHSLRRTFCSLLYEAGASPAYVMSQMGHRSSALALEVYAQVVEMHQSRDTGARMDALIRSADWATMGATSLDAPPTASVEATRNLA